MTDILAKIVIIILAVLVAGGAKYALQMKNDNPVEQVAEVIIKDQTGVEIDLSPDDEKVDGSNDSVDNTEDVK
jgi:uncharacterized protein YpmB